ncbi:CAP domain-containing protein [Acaryochloris sp. IP29b_bin.148]|uniref:CAP domain-containing protein n=1 Tax=Acaryochloris sp. IP29b_bin.148 TaxID=2969218 RepID=UPI002630CB71|nr:CAP domain-containing protein [Acaryochloris sp. IP29b_bin.148]
MAILNQDKFDQKILQLVNQERSSAGLNTLSLSQKLDQAADGHSKRMATGDFFSHNDPQTGTSAGDRIEAAGYTDWSTWGENIAAGQTTPEAVVQGWMRSSGHRANILNPNFTHMGLGYHLLTNDTGQVNYSHYWTQVFGAGANPGNYVAQTDGQTTPPPQQPPSPKTPTAGNDLLKGTNQSDKIAGLAGNDTIKGANGADTLSGNSGSDSIYGQAGNDRLYGGKGNDRLKGDLGNDLLRGGIGNDYLEGGSGNDQLFGESGKDKLRGGSSRDTLDGAQGNDSLYGDGGNDLLQGREGNDRLYGGSGRDKVIGNKGNDTMYGGLGNDSLYGGEGSDVLMGIGANSSASKSQKDTLKGGTGGDLYILGNKSQAFYNDGKNNSLGAGDYAHIEGYEVTQGDKIRLHGTASDYRLGSSPKGTPSGQAIFLKTSGTDELIAIVGGANSLNLNGSGFTYTS